MRLKLSTRRRRKKQKEEANLQITSLADILIIILVFLLKAVSTQIEQVDTVTVPKGISLPSVTKAKGGEDGLKIEISERYVSIEGKKVANLRRYRFTKSDLNDDLQNGGSSRALSKALLKIREAKDNTGEKRAWIIADNKAPYATIQTVLASAAIHGYEEFKLAVVPEN